MGTPPVVRSGEGGEGRERRKKLSRSRVADASNTRLLGAHARRQAHEVDEGALDDAHGGEAAALGERGRRGRCALVPRRRRRRLAASELVPARAGGSRRPA